MLEDKDAEIKTKYDDFSVDELKAALKSIFFYAGEFSAADMKEMDQIMAVLEKKEPLSQKYTAEESWKRFQETYGEELSSLGVRDSEEVVREESAADKEKDRPASEQKAVHHIRHSRLIRIGMIAAIIVVIAFAAAITASALGCSIFGWIPKWNNEAFSFSGEEANPNELSDASPIEVTLAQMGIDEPLYPHWLPKGFRLTTSVVEMDPLFLHESYFNGDNYLSITIEPSLSAQSYAYQMEASHPLEYSSNNTMHYIITDVDQYTAIWQTEHYSVYIVGNITLDEMKQVIDSVKGVEN